MTAIEAPRSYGGWRAQRGLGVVGLSGPESTLIALHIFAFMACAGWYRPGIVPVLLSFFVSVVLVSRVDGVAVWTRLFQLFRWYTPSARRNGQWLLPTLVGDQKTSPLPGELANTTAWEIKAPGLDPYGIISDDKTQTMAVTFRGNPQQLQLADPGEIDSFVANWAHFLDSLVDIPQISQIQVTVASSVDRSGRIERLLESMKRPDSPEVSLTIMDDLADHFSSGVIRSQTLVTVTFDPPLVGKSSPESMITDIHGYVLQIRASLAGPGLTSVRPMTAAELAADLRGQFSPLLRPEIDRSLNDPEEVEIFQWKNAGPTKASEQSEFYSHDGVRTVSWGLTLPPRETVTSNILYRMLRPGRFSKRVTFLWHPIPPAKAQRQLETQRFLSDMWRRVRQQNNAHETMRETRDSEKTDVAALLEADGSGFGNFTLIATTSFEDLGTPELNAQAKRLATQDMQGSSGSSRLSFRELEKSHSLGLVATSVAGLPVVKALKSQ